MRKFTAVLIAVFAFASSGYAACSGSSPTWNCPAVATDITNLIAGSWQGPAVAGDTINVAAGTIASLTATVNGIQLRGAGTNLALGTEPTTTSGTIIQAGTITVTKHATYNSRVSGFSYTGTSHFLDIGGTSSNKPFIIDHNFIHSNGGESTNRMVDILVNGGVLFANSFTMDNCVACNQDVFAIQTSETWNDGDDTMGSADTTGERNIYFEGNWFNGILETAPDCDARSRVVFRYNNYKDSSIVCHSGYETTPGYSDTTTGGGVRHYEVYGNYFIRVSNSLAVNKWIWMRGATGIIGNNAMDRSSSPDGSTYPNKPVIRLSTNCTGTGQTYPLEHQIGQINKVTDATPDKPLLIFGTVAGAGSNGPGDANFITVDESNSGGLTCPPGSATTYIQLNRDYKTTNAWSWTPYTCPHPLAGAGSCATVTTYADAGIAGYSLSNCTPAKLLYSAQPSSAALGATLGTISVGVYDSSNVLCTAATNTITLAKTGGTCTGMTLNGTVSGAATSGVFTTTDATMTVATGACTLTASASGLTDAVSSSFTISAAGTGGGIGARLRLMIR
jgi:hypothetical protein